MQLLRLGKGVLVYYRANVNGNETISDEDAQKKLTRNVLLAKPVGENKNGKQLFLYGNMEILVVGDTIVWLKNHKGRNKKWHRPDPKMYRLWNHVMGIPEDRPTAA